MKLEHNFYTLMGLPQQFDVDTAELKKRARQLQRQYHPDRLSQATPQEQRLAAQFSAQVNTAVTVLGNPVKRALHLLELAQMQVDHQNHTVKDATFLMEQMKLREALEDAREANHAELLERLYLEVEEHYRASQKKFAVTDIGEGKAINGSATDERVMLNLIAQMRFFEKLEQEIRDAIKAL